MPIPTDKDITDLWHEAANLDQAPHRTQLHTYSHLLLARFPVLLAGDKATAAIKAENQRLWVALESQNPSDAAFMALMREYLDLKEQLGDAKALNDKLRLRNRSLEALREQTGLTREALESARDAVIGAIDELSALQESGD